MSFPLSATALLALTISAPAQDGDTGQESPAVETAQTTGTFAWPVPARVVVTEDVLKKGKTVRMRYEVRTQKQKDTENILVALRNFEFLNVNGRDATTPQAKAALASALDMTSAIPLLVVDKEGNYLRTTGLDDVIQRVLDEGAKRKGAKPEERAQVEATMNAPAFRQAMEASAGQFWNAWVGAWTGWELANGKVQQSETKLPLGEFEMPATLTLTNHGPVKGAKGHVRLSVGTLATGAEARKVYAQFMRKMFGEAMARSGKEFTDDMLTKLRIDSKAEVVTRLEDLRPLRAMYEKNVMLEITGSGTQRNVERRSYRFDWKN